ncbi:tetratricopeptide repeat protein [Roseateles saccharophilus]|uniref:Sel1 repeat-containing protein n=1 Tax=Roseateles saccharophilus TaxID=304 RepID=A0A4R3U5J4_ROSSA|nr:tetratricopeptide repeat protein [Roseateles saccharophilus]MDG0836236.1 sel1 repeat family protein [Roseateles saccharophilus]TCU81358.1 Sel1 repeat-containing protein [Roseateles saccharophilus]
MNCRDPGPGLTLPAAALATPPIDPLQQALALFHATPPDYRRAVGWFRAAAESGSSDGLAMLGLCQLEGLGMAADAVAARTLLERAAALGSAIGRFQLGRMLMTGRGGPADEAAGLSAYVAAAALGHAEASFNLANCLYAGVGCLPDRLAAKALYLRSRTLGCTLRPQGVLVQQRELKAVRTLALRFADPNRLVFLVQERQQELALVQAVVQPRNRAPRDAVAKKPKALRQAGLLAAGVVAAMAGTLGQYLRPASRDAGPTTINF